MTNAKVKSCTANQLFLLVTCFALSSFPSPLSATFKKAFAVLESFWSLFSAGPQWVSEATKLLRHHWLLPFQNYSTGTNDQSETNWWEHWPIIIKNTLIMFIVFFLYYTQLFTLTSSSFTYLHSFIYLFLFLDTYIHTYIDFILIILSFLNLYVYILFVSTSICVCVYLQLYCLHHTPLQPSVFIVVCLLLLLHLCSCFNL